MNHSQKIKNCLRLYRKKQGLSQKQVAYLMGFKATTSISRYEHGTKQPSLDNALKLEIIYYTPVAFLFDALHRELKQEIQRRREEKERVKEL